mmetsp:Transcript_17628/g.40805  ORF Transcript_17628/g.40805 Transcript_17628/m.40805 type:complete len:419 (+) Transcript_17628:120-1376(+)
MKLIVWMCIFGLSAVEGAVPRFIWSYWHNHSALPKTVRLATKSWATYAPDFEVRLLSKETWSKYLDNAELDTKLAKLDSKKFADWLRVSVLARYGGVWMDATMLLFVPLETLIDQGPDIEMSGVRYANNFEPYFIAAREGSEIMQRWQVELVKVFAMSKDEFERHLIQMRAAGIAPLNGGYTGCSYRYRFQEVLLHLVVRIGNTLLRMSPWADDNYIFPCGEHFWVHYLIVLVALNTALQADGTDTVAWWRSRGIAVQEALDTVLAVADSQNFQDNITAEFMMTHRSSGVVFSDTPALKLRASERNFIEQWDHCEEGSLICRLQMHIGDSVFRVRNATAGIDGLVRHGGIGALPNPTCSTPGCGRVSAQWDASLVLFMVLVVSGVMFRKQVLRLVKCRPKYILRAIGSCRFPHPSMLI